MEAYVRKVALRMAQSCLSNLNNASPVVWLGFEHWSSLVRHEVVQFDSSEGVRQVTANIAH